MSRARRLACLVASLLTASGTVVILASNPGLAGASAPTAAVVTLGASAPEAPAGSSLTLTATVTGSTPTGRVAFLGDGAPLSCGGSDSVALSGGTTETATCAVSHLAGPSGEESFTALYLGDGANLPASASLEEPVTAAATVTTLSAPGAAAGAPVTYGATVTTTAGTTPTGTVVFSDDGVAIASCGGAAGVGVSGGSAQCTLPSGYSSAGSHLIEAAYAGTGTLAPSEASAVEEIGAPPTGRSTTSTALYPSTLAPGAGSPVTLGAVVTSQATPPEPPSGTLTFTLDGVALPACHDLAATPVQGSGEAGAVCPVTGGLPAATPQDVQALFTPATGSALAPSLAPPVTIDPLPGTAAVTVTASPDPAPGGSLVTITASVSADATGAPATGQVQLDAGGAPASCAEAVSGLLPLASGAATCTLDAPAPGATLVVASFLGNASLQPATAVAPLTVDPPLAATTVVVTSSSNPVATGTSVAYTAAVSGGSTPPTGTVAFKAGSSPISGCASVALSSGSAVCTVSGYSAASTVVVTATYAGDGSHLAGVGQMTEVVTGSGLTAPSMQLAATADPAANGQSVTYTARVTGAGSAPTGPVAFTDAGRQISSCGAVSLTSQGGLTSQASCTVAGGYFADLTHLIVASYSGDGTTFTPASAALAEGVLPLAPLVALSAAPSFAAVGSPESLTASLSGTLGEPSGSAEFEEGDAPVASCQSLSISAGLASCPIPAISAPGAFDVATDYSGDEFYAPAVAALGDEATQTGAAPATIRLTATSSASPGTDVQYSITVSGAGATPTGSVEMTDGGAPLTACGAGGIVSLSSGTATCDAGSALAVGMHDVAASYRGDVTYAPASTLVAEPVSVAASGTAGGSGSGGAGSGGGAPAGSGGSGGGVPGAGLGSAPGTAGTAAGAAPGSATEAGPGGSQGGPSGSSSATPAPPSGTSAGATSGSGTGRQGRNPSPAKRTSRRPSLVLSAPHAGPPHQPVVYRARVAGSRGPVAGTVTFSVDGRPVRGCTRVALGRSSSLEVTCTLASGFPSPGYQLVAVTYSGSRQYDRASSAVLEHVLPRWSGYWLVAPTGRVAAYGAAAPLAPRGPLGPVVAAAMTPDAGGLWLLSRTGSVSALGTARSYGSASPGEGPYTAIAPTRDGRGYWVLARSGAVVSFGDARRLGPARATAGAGPFVAIAATPDGLGCWILSADGAVFARGDARTYPLRGAHPLQPGAFVAIAPSGDGRGYTLLSARGALVAFGDALPGSRLVRPPAGGFASLLATADHRGFWLAGRKDVVVALGDARRLPPRTDASPVSTLAIAGT